MWPLAVCIVVLLYLYASRWMDAVYRYAAGVALFGHFIVAVVVLPRVPYGWDIAKFHNSAISILNGQTPEAASTVASFATFQSLIYISTGPETVSLSIVNGLMAILLPFPLQYMMRELYPELRTTYIATLVVLFLPLPFVMLTVPMRDSLAVLVFTTILALFVGTIKERSLGPITLASPLWGILYLFRPELALITILGGGAAAFVFTVDTVTARTVSLSELIVGVAPIGVLGFVLFASRYPLDSLQSRVSYRASGSAAYLELFQYESWLDVIVSAPGRAIYFQFAPFPLHVEQIFHLLALLSLPILIVLATAAAFSIYDCETDRVTLVFLLVVYSAGVVGYGLIDSNFGTTARHRVSFVFLLVVFASPVLDRWWLELRRAYDVPEESSKDKEHHRKAEELDDLSHIRQENSNDTQ